MLLVNMLLACASILRLLPFRFFTNEVNRYDPNNLLSTNRKDFTLYVVGEFDLSSGCVVNRDPRVLIHGRDILTVSLPDAPYGGKTAE